MKFEYIACRWGDKAMKLKKIVTYILAPIPTILTIIAIDYFIYYVIEKKADQRGAITATIIITVFLISFIAYALYDTKIKHRGESMSAFEKRQTAKMMKYLSQRVSVSLSSFSRFSFSYSFIFEPFAKLNKVA